jgi:hypothetical protein
MTLLPKWWRGHFLLVEFCLAVALTFGFAGWYIWFGGNAIVSPFLNGNRPSIYGTAASVFGSLLGFVITATSIVLGFSASDRLKVIRESTQYQTLWQVFNATIRALGLATVAAFLALIFDRDSSPIQWVLFVVIFGALGSLFRFLRAIWVLENIIDLLTMTRTQEGDERH